MDRSQGYFWMVVGGRAETLIAAAKKGEVWLETRLELQAVKTLISINDGRNLDDDYALCFMEKKRMYLNYV